MIIQFRRAAGVGEGTAVKIYLPRLIGRVEIDDDEMQPLVGSAGGETILVVEDDKDV